MKINWKLSAIKQLCQTELEKAKAVIFEAGDQSQKFSKDLTVPYNEGVRDFSQKIIDLIEPPIENKDHRQVALQEYKQSKIEGWEVVKLDHDQIIMQRNGKQRIIKL